MSNVRSFGLMALIAALVLLYFSVFIVKEWEKAILFRLGEVVRADYEPGLHFKIPFITNVRKFDARIFSLDVEPERFLTVEKKNMIVDSYVKWRIQDVTRFYTAVQGDERQAQQRLTQIIKDGMRGEFGNRTVNEVVSGERIQIMNLLKANADDQARTIGIRIVDVRIKRIDLPAEVSDSVYRRMRAERERVAKDFRSRGMEAAERIKADADRQRQVLLAEAYRDAETLRGEGDATAANIYALAYGQDTEFYSMHRSLGAYRRTFQSQNDLLVLEPDSEFFEYFGNAQGRR
jgi:membrane protease subunit HflC